MSESRYKDFYFTDRRLTSARKYSYITIAPALIYFLPVILGGLIYFYFGLAR